MAKFVLAIDQGTTGTTALVFDQAGALRGRAYGAIRQSYPRPGWVEHDPEELYRSVLRTGKAALRAARVGERELAAIGLTNQRETFVVWERATAQPVHPAIVWQCRRSSEICRTLREREDEISRRTGLLADPYFAGTKLKWLLDQKSHLRRRAARNQLCFGTIDTWILFKLTRGRTFVTDYTNASRTMLMNLETREWDPAMLEMLDVPWEMLPGLVASRGPIAEAPRGTFASHPVAIGALIGDQQSALFGQGCTRLGEAKVTYGTGAFLLVNTGAVRPYSQHRLIATAALGNSGQSAFALEGAVFIAGAAIQWLRDELGLISEAAETDALARQSADRLRPWVVPAFVGLGAPYWDSEARGAILDLTRGTTRADLVRATLDSIAYQVGDVLAAMEQDTRKPIRALRVDGGAAANDYLMQFQADLIGRTIVRPLMAETTALGAALLAGLAVGVWRSADQMLESRMVDRRFRPTMKSPDRKRLRAGWRAAVRRVLTTGA
ncbi:MAG TPA: glycerol kinase GlpK [Candidatus Binataceae bacterium]|nr:glycerol kinase GlpK [Candidatus Binataceae bacterium]